MEKTFSRYETADYLESEEDIRLYLETCQQEDDPALLTAALSDIARARNMSRLAKDAGMTRAGLYKAAIHLRRDSLQNQAIEQAVANCSSWSFCRIRRSLNPNFCPVLSW